MNKRGRHLRYGSSEIGMAKLEVILLFAALLASAAAAPYDLDDGKRKQRMFQSLPLRDVPGLNFQSLARRRLILRRKMVSGKCFFMREEKNLVPFQNLAD